MRMFSGLLLCVAACAPAVHFEPVKAGGSYPQHASSDVEVFFAPPPRAFAEIGVLTMYQPPSDTSSIVTGFRHYAGSYGCEGIVLAAAAASQPSEQQARCIVWSAASYAKGKPMTEIEACEHGDSDSCIRAGAAAEAAKDLPGALSAYQHACDAQNRRGCTHAAILEQNGGVGIKADPVLAAQLFAKSCLLDDFVACRYLGLAQMQGQGVSKDAAAGLANLQKACGGKDGWACYRLGKMHLAGEGVAKDRTKASDEFAQACAADYKPACGM